jgi:hypothetical protein
MEKTIYKQPLMIPKVLGVFFLFYGLALNGLDTKRFDAPPPKRPMYLTFAKPTPLRFSISPLPVDRNNIALPARNPQLQNTVLSQITTDNNQTIPRLPSLSSGFDQNSSSVPSLRPSNQNPPPFLPQLVPPSILPLSDPFQDLNSFGTDSTDELLQILESSDVGTSGSSLQVSPFVPPYTVAPDGLRIGSKATYRRIKR